MTDDPAVSAAPTAREWLVRIFERGNRQYAIIERHGGKIETRDPQTGPNWFRCADGTVLSIVAGWGTYCSPRPDWPEEWGGVPKDYTGPFSAVEVWFESAGEREGHVEADRLWAYINEHGGVTDYLPPGETPEKGGWA